MRPPLSVAVLSVLLAACLFGSLPAQEPTVQPELYVTLPEICPTPDGMALDADGAIILACPN